jgi:hypothetical protein
MGAEVGVQVCRYKVKNGPEGENLDNIHKLHREILE